MKRTLDYFCKMIDCEHIGEGSTIGVNCKLCSLGGTSLAHTYYPSKHKLSNLPASLIIKRFQDKCPNKQIIKQIMAMADL